jgi:hypothetical protein
VSWYIYAAYGRETFSRHEPQAGSGDLHFEFLLRMTGTCKDHFTYEGVQVPFS